MSNVVIVGCSRRKVITDHPIHAIDLYQGGYVPFIRNCILLKPKLRNQVFILSAKYGLLGADDPVLNYDQLLTMEEAKILRPLVWNSLQERILKSLIPKEILVITEPLYFYLIADIFSIVDIPRIYWEPEIRNESKLVNTILNKWAWIEELK